MRRSHLYRRGLSFLLVAPSFLMAQDSSSVFRSDVRLKEVNLIASTKDGPVLDLTRDDFEIYEDGKRREIKLFLPQGPEPVSFRTVSSSPVVANTPAVTGAHTVILLDWLNTDLPDRAYASQKLTRMLSTVQPNDLVAIYVIERGLRVVHDFSSDPAILAEAVRRMRGNADTPPDLGAFGPATRATEEIARLDLRTRAAITQASLKQIQQRMAGIPGRKNLIWLSSRFGENWSPQTPGLAVYPVDSRGLTSGNPLDLAQSKAVPSLIAAAIQRADEKKIQQLSKEASLTGGHAYTGRNDLDAVMREILDDGATSYTLGYTVPEAPKPGKHTIRVRVARKGVTLRYADSFTVEKPTPPEDTAKRMGEAFTRPLDITELPIAGSARPIGDSVRLNIQVPTSLITLTPLGEGWQVRLDLAVRFIAPDDVGTGAAQYLLQTMNLPLAGDAYQKALTDGLSITAALSRPPTANSLRLLVRDVVTGVLGTLTLSIE